jgi:hypothetical protein
MKITKKELVELIREGVEKKQKEELLKESKSKIENAIKRLDEGEVLSEEEIEELWAGLKGVGQMLKKKAGDAAQSLQQKAQDFGGQVKQKAQAAGQQVKQAYQGAEREAAYKKAQDQMASIAQQLKDFDKQVAAKKKSLQQQYMKLSGGKPFKGAVHNPVLSESLSEEKYITSNGISIPDNVMSLIKDTLLDPEAQHDFNMGDDLDTNISIALSNPDILNIILKGHKSAYEHDIEMERKAGEDVSYLLDTYNDIIKVLSKF